MYWVTTYPSRHPGIAAAVLEAESRQVRAGGGTAQELETLEREKGTLERELERKKGTLGGNWTRERELERERGTREGELVQDSWTRSLPTPRRAWRNAGRDEPEPKPRGRPWRAAPSSTKARARESLSERKPRESGREEAGGGIDGG